MQQMAAKRTRVHQSLNCTTVGPTDALSSALYRRLSIHNRNYLSTILPLSAAIKQNKICTWLLCIHIIRNESVFSQTLDHFLTTKTVSSLLKARTIITTVIFLNYVQAFLVQFFH